MRKQINQLEEFKDVQNYYEVDEAGVIYGSKGQLKPSDTGTVSVRLKDGKTKKIEVDKIVDEAFNTVVHATNTITGETTTYASVEEAVRLGGFDLWQLNNNSPHKNHTFKIGGKAK